MRIEARPLGAFAGLGIVLVVATACAARNPAAAPVTPEPAIDPAPAARTGAVTTVVESETSVAPHIRIDEYLRARIPGLIVIPARDGGFTLRLRGANMSLASGREVQPLVVIDGLPIDPQQLSRVLPTLRPSDIKRIDVLRDVASISVYGMRGASGVILIRTIE
jgi:TonB-dependent SusC/RagA subfamily outer membrane receptor